MDFSCALLRITLSFGDEKTKVEVSAATRGLAEIGDRNADAPRRTDGNSRFVLWWRMKKTSPDPLVSRY